MLYQRIVVSTGEAVGDPGDLPAVLLGNLSAADLADLSWLPPEVTGFEGQGFVPYVPEPTPPVLRTDSVFDFMYGRFTLAERLAIHASTDPVVQDFVRALAVIPRVELDAALTVQGVNYMEAQGLIAAGRAAQVLA